MSKEALERFLAQATADSRLAADLRAAVGSATGMVAERAVADFAAQRGYAVGPEDVRELTEEADTAGDLSDEQLEHVAGGDVSSTMLSLLTALRSTTSGPLS